MAITATSPSPTTPSKSVSEAPVKATKGRSNAETEKVQQQVKARNEAANSAPAKPPVVNTSGQTTGTRINTTA